MVSAETRCLCKKTVVWVTEGEVTKQHCPCCGRSYKGVYNKKTLTIDAIEVKGKWNVWCWLFGHKVEGGIARCGRCDKWVDVSGIAV